MPAGMPKRILTGKDRKRFMVNCSLKKKEGQFRAGKMGASDLKQARSPCTQTIHCSKQQEVEKGRWHSLLNDPTGCLNGLLKPRREK